MKHPLVTIGFINFGVKDGYSSLPYLSHFLEALTQQTYTNVEILCLDNHSTDGSLEYIKKHKTIKVIELDENTGFVGHNILIEQAKGAYYWCTNFDMIFEPQTLARLVEAAEQYEDGGSFGGTLLEWDFTHLKKTTKIDSCGITLSKDHQFSELYAGEDLSKLPEQAMKINEVFGISGANVLYRMSALKKIKDEQGNYFDSHFFMYKEDIDIAYRLQWENWKAYHVPDALLYHDRTVGVESKDHAKHREVVKNRKMKSTANRYYSLRNHLFVLYKNISYRYPWSIMIKVMLYECKKLFYVMLFEREVLRAYSDFFTMRKDIIETKKTANPGQIIKFMT